MERAFVCIGSNIDPEKNIIAALRLLLPHGLAAVSMVYRTEPVNSPGQADFYNCVAELETDDGPREIKYNLLRPIEERLGRRRTEDKYAPRTIDLDLIAYGSLELKEEGLVLPDPEIETRPFILFPLLELAPDFTLPSGKNLLELSKVLSMAGMEELTDYTAFVRFELFDQDSAPF